MLKSGNLIAKFQPHITTTTTRNETGECLKCDSIPKNLQTNLEFRVVHAPGGEIRHSFADKKNPEIQMG